MIENNHYFSVMAWRNQKLKNAPIYMKKFDIYEDAEEFYHMALDNLGANASARLFEFIDGKRKIILNSDDEK